MMVGKIKITSLAIASLILISSSFITATATTTSPSSSPASATPVLPASCPAPATTPNATPAPTPTPAVGAAPGPDCAAIEAQIQLALQKQAQIDALKASLASTVQAASNQQKVLLSLITSSEDAIKTTLAQIAQAQQDYQAAVAKQTKAEADEKAALDKETQDRKMLTAYLKMRYSQGNDLGNYILSSNSFSQMLDREADVSHILDQGQSLMQSLQEDVNKAAKSKQDALDAQTAAQAAQVHLGTQYQDLKTQLQKNKDLLAQMSVTQNAALNEIKQASTDNLALAQQIAQLRLQQLDDAIAQAQDLAWKEAFYFLQNHLGSLPANITIDPKTGAQWAWPAPGTTFEQAFGPSSYDFEPPGFGFPHFHTGIDMAGALGTPIFAPADGIVVAATPGNTGYGNHLILAHAANMLTLYGHLETMLVKPGDTIHKGQLIALMGSTGNSTGPHLHFEVRVNNTPVNPVPFMVPLPSGATGPPPLPKP